MKLFRTGVPCMIALLLTVNPGWGQTRTVQGVAIPESITIDNISCPLVGTGIRKELIINVYVGALYLAKPTKIDRDVITSEQPKQVAIHVVYNEISPEQLTDAWTEGFKNNVPGAVQSLSEQIKTFNGFFTEPVKKGDTILVTYSPGKGTEVTIKDKVCGTIPGHDFMEAVFSIWFGPKPPTGGLKKGMLGA